MTEDNEFKYPKHLVTGGYLALTAVVCGIMSAVFFFMGCEQFGGIPRFGECISLNDEFHMLYTIAWIPGVSALISIGTAAFMIWGISSKD